MTIKQALLATEEQLRSAQAPDPQIDAELLLAHVTGMDRMTLRLNGGQTLTPEQEQQLAPLLLSRTQRVPLQYLLGTQYFYGLTLRVDSRALIPRQETETLCELGIAHLSTLCKGDPTLHPCVLDLCTGSGAIALAVKHECPIAQVTACDASPEALALARENAQQNGLDVTFLQGDLFAPVKGQRFHVILSNPPYIPTAEHDRLQPEVRFEPRMALDGGADGLDFYRRIAAQAPAMLLPGGLLAVEVGDGQAQRVAALFEAAGLGGVSIQNDLYRLPRVVRGQAFL